MADGFNNGGDYSFLWFLALLGLSELGAYAIVRREWFEVDWHYYAALTTVGVGIWSVLAGAIFACFKLAKHRRE